MDSDRQVAEVGVKAAGVTSRLTPPLQIAAPFREGYFCQNRNDYRALDAVHFLEFCTHPARNLVEQLPL